MNENFFKTEFAYENWKHKYQYKNETPLGTFKRIAKALAINEIDSIYWENKFLNAMIRFDLNGNPIGLKNTPGGRITANAGTDYKNATLMNCFINGPVKNAKIEYIRENNDKSISYDIKMKTPNDPDDLVNIFLTLMEQAKTLASEGGWGSDISWIRPRGSIIKGTGILHPGVVSYLDIFDSISECIVKGIDDGYVDKLKNYFKDDKFEQLKNSLKTQTRKGAQICVLRVDHPDIEEFIKAKQTPGRLTKFNMSVGITDKFMIACKNNEMFNLTFNEKIYKTVKAKELYSLIMDSTYNRGEPGVIFLDNAMKNNPLEYVDKITASNPCSEIMGMGSLTSVCLLGNCNLTQYVKINENNKSYFDFNEYKDDLKIFLRMLDNVCDLSRLPLQSYEFFVKNFRMIGIGINGLGSTLLMLDIPYNSKDGIEFTKKICSLKENILWEASAEIAKEKGTFPQYNKDKFINTTYFKSDRITKNTKNIIKQYGVRNSKTSTAPPNGNTSVICDYTSNGIEPIFDLEVNRKVICEWPNGMTIDNVKSILKQKKKKDFIYWEGTYNNKMYYYEPHNRGLCKIKILRDYGYQWLIDNFPEKINNNNAIITTKKLTIDNHLDIQEAVQYFNNQSTSKCLVKGQIIKTNFGNLKIEDLCLNKNNINKEGFYKCKKSLKVFDENGKYVNVKQFYYGGIKPAYKISLNNGSYIKASENHKFKSQDGFIKSKHLKIDDLLMTQNYKENYLNNRLKILKKQNFLYITNIEYLGKQPVYDIEVDSKTHLYLVNNVISHNTVNVHNKYPFNKFKELYFNGWKRGLIGLTTYRDGSMESVLEHIENAEEKKEIIKKGVKLPETFINGETKTIKREGMKFYIHFSYLPEDNEMKYPIAIWITTNSKNDVRAANRACKKLGKLAVNCGISLAIVEDTWDKCLGDNASNRLARMVSLCLRHNIARQDILVALKDVKDDNVSTLLTAVRKFIGETIDDGTQIIGMQCPECQSDSIIMQSGCFICNDCGYSGCGA